MQPALCNRAYVLLCVFVRKAAAALVTVSAGDRQLLDSDRETFSLHLSLSLSLSPEDVCVNTQCVPYINSYEETITALQNTQNIPRLQMHANTDKRKSIQGKLRALLTLRFGEKFVTYF